MEKTIPPNFIAPYVQILADMCFALWRYQMKNAIKLELPTLKSQVQPMKIADLHENYFGFL